ncbi:hypothetical protein PR003_g22747 [Phytophthora rubi]|uniref:WRKY19-like zinc finger domain-containing protein n=2 Tax=Phytophthora rubi TaxID=129364 RepID=A0A6A4D2Y9_9STRA|nr:hypothetical protein PR003_g22747 [Phytophthora rubi]
MIPKMSPSLTVMIVPTVEQKKQERRPTATRELAPPKATGRGNTRSNSARTVTAEIQAPKDKTALEIAANEALFGGGADEPWGLALSSTGGSGAPWGVADSSSWHGNNSASATQAAAAATGGDLFTRGSGNHNPRTSGKGKTVRKAKGGGDTLPLLASANGSSMGSYDRDAHLRMQMPHPPPATTIGMGSHQLPTHRVKATSGNNPNTGPYFHHFLDRSSTANSSTNSLLFNPSNSFPDTTSNTLGKRPRSSNNGNFSSSFGGYPSPPPFDADHPLPDFITNWGFTSRAGTKGNNSTSSSAPVLCSSSATTTSSHSNSNVTTSSSLSGMGSPNAASMFAGVDSFLPDYDSSLYSLWTAPGGYDTENDATQGQQQQQVQPPLYMTSEDELKLDYPQLPEFNQDLDSYLNDPMDAGGPSPTTPLGTTSTGNNNGMMKMDHLDRRTHLTTGDRLLAPAAATATAEYLVRQGRGLENTSRRSVKRSRGAFDDAYAAPPVSSGSSFKNAPIEPKRALMPSLGSFQPGTSTSLLMPTSAMSSQVETPSSVAMTSTTSVTPTSDTASSKGSKRPRSRQCEFPGCQNRARSHQKCKKHGGAHQCVFEGCTKNSQSRGLCIAHGGGSRCTREGCVRAAQSKGLCKSHGGGEYCAVEGCHKKAHLKHLCRTHGGGVRCKIDKCSKWAQRKGWCMAHAKEFSAT